MAKCFVFIETSRGGRGVQAFGLQPPAPSSYFLVLTEGGLRHFFHGVLPLVSIVRAKHLIIGKPPPAVGQTLAGGSHRPHCSPISPQAEAGSLLRSETPLRQAHCRLSATLGAGYGAPVDCCTTARIYATRYKWVNGRAGRASASMVESRSSWRWGDKARVPLADPAVRLRFANRWVCAQLPIPG